MYTVNPFEEIIDRLSRIEQAIITLRDNNESPARSQDSDVPLSIHQVSEIIGKSVPTIYGYVHRRTIPHMKKGQKLYFFKNQIINWIKSGKVKTTEEIQQVASKTLSK